MSEMVFEEFSSNTRFTPVPNPIFGPLLEQIHDIAELKFVLRLIWLLHHKRGHPKYVYVSELMSDRTLAMGLGGESVPTRRRRVETTALKAAERGIIVSGEILLGGSTLRVFMLNTKQNRKELSRLVVMDTRATDNITLEPWEGSVDRPNVYAIYEDNIGVLTPIIADQVREAEVVYPTGWLEDAIREAADRNRRNWRYIASILERWYQDGRRDGESRGNPRRTHYI